MTFEAVSGNVLTLAGSSNSNLSSNSTNLFIYGSLITGGYLHPLMAGCTLLTTSALTQTGFSLVDLGLFPGLVQLPDLQSKVSGELYTVSPQRLATLDHLESEGYLYNRIELEFADGDLTVTADTYLLHPQISKEWPLEAIEKGLATSPYIRNLGDDTYRWQPLHQIN